VYAHKPAFTKQRLQGTHDQMSTDSHNSFETFKLLKPNDEYWEIDPLNLHVQMEDNSRGIHPSSGKRDLSN